MRYLIILLIFPLAGCMTADKTVRVKKDRFSESIKILGREVVHKDQGLFNTKRFKHFLRSYVNKKTGQVTHQLYFTTDYSRSDWHNYETAKLKGGRGLKVEQIGSDVTVDQYGTRYYETLIAIIPNKILKDNKDGFFVKWYAQSGHSVKMLITPEQVKQQLAAVERELKEIKAKK